MDTLYWLGEYGKVFFAFIFLMFVWPSVVFAGHLKGKSKTYRFAFCTTVQILIITTVILLLGLCRILNGWVVVGIFYGIFVWCVIKRIKKGTWRSAASAITRLHEGTYKFKTYLHNVAESIKRGIKKLFSKLKGILLPNIWEYSILGALVLFAMIYFSYGVFNNYGYGFGDMFVHNQWIDGMLDGKIFYNGIYPEGMHCVIYCLHVLFGIKLYSIIMLLANVQIIVTFISAYVFLRSIFRWKFSPFFALLLFLILDVVSVYEIYSMSRLQWTLPMEFGMYTEFLGVYYYVKYLKTANKMPQSKRVKRQKYIWNDNLLIFSAAIAASVAIHFYCTVLLILLLIPFIIFNITKLFTLKKFVPLAVAFFIGFGIAVMPMAIAFAEGIPFQGSLRWATGVISSGDRELEDETKQEIIEKPAENASIGNKIEYAAKIIYQNGYAKLYGRNRANLFIGVTIFTLVLWAGYCLVWALPRIRKKNNVQNADYKKEENYFNGYLPIIASTVLFMFMYVAFKLGLPQIISGMRLCSMENLLLLTVAVMPLDMIFALLTEFCRRIILKIASLAVIAAMYLLTLATGTYRGFLLHELTRYNSEVIVTNAIINNFPQHSYTIVSCASEIYQVNRFGRHEELLRFVNEIDTDEYFIPTEYVFVFVEKRPIEYAQIHFYAGPEWLAQNKYSEYFRKSLNGRKPWSTSVGSEVLASVITQEAAQVSMENIADNFTAYKNLWQRTVIESKAYQWCQSFKELFPFEMDVYYEDDNFVCYYFKQNPQSLYNLAIDDWNDPDEKWIIEL